MKPNFALGLTDDGITLWHRSGDGWLRVGAVALDSDDFVPPMRTLVEKARLLAPDAITTKLVIPGEHLLLTQAHAPGPGAAAQASQIRTALAGRTPFPPEELVFDWFGASSDVAVVVTARETLIEAEDFATEHGLNPVCFVAALPAPGFRGEPFLGLTRRARAMGMTAESITRDPAILRETGIARMPAPKPPVAKVEIAAAQPKAPDTKPAPPAEPTPAYTEVETPSAAPTPSANSIDAPKAGQLVPPVTTPKPELLKTPEPPSADIAPFFVTPNDGPKAPLLTAPEPDTSAAFRTRRTPNVAPTPAASPVASAPRVQDAAPKPAPRPKTDFAKIAQAKLTSGRAAILAQIKVASAALRNAVPKSREKEAAPAETPDATLARLRAVAEGSSSAPVSVKSAAAQPTKSKADAAPARLSPVETLRRVQGQNIATPTTEAERMTVFGARGATPDQDTPRNRALLVAGGGLLVLVAAAIWALYFVAQPSEQAETAAPALTEQVIEPPVALPEDVAERTPDEGSDLAAIEAALGADDAAEAERPLEDGSDGTQAPPENATADVTAPAAVSEPGAGQTAPVAAEQSAAPSLSEPAQDRQIAEIRSGAIELPNDLSPPFAAPAGPAPFGTDPLPPVREAEVATPPTTPNTPSPNPAMGFSTGTPIPLPEGGAAPSLPLAEQGLNIPVQTGLPPSRPPEKPARFSEPEGPAADQDASLNLQEAGSEQAASAQQSVLEPVAVSVLPTEMSELSVPSVAQNATVDAEANLIVVVTRAAPPVTPPVFAAPLEPVTAAVPQALDADQSGLAAQSNQALGSLVVLPPTPDAAVSEEGLRIAVVQAAPAVIPPRRSADLATQPEPPDPSAATANSEIQADQSLPPPGGILLSALARPAPRPSDLSSNIATQAALAAFPDATAQAVARSPRPEGKPSELGQIVQRTLAAAALRERVTPPPADVAPAPEPIQTASAAAAAMPNLPTSTSVAREATQSRAINLRQVNLLGVMGTNSNRRALVRLSNGRVVTVRVGERLDDGQVTAIGDSELRYNRRGRDVVLRIAS